MTVSVIVPTWKRHQWLDKCLKGLSRQTASLYEILVVGRPEDHSTKSVVFGWREAGLPIQWHTVTQPGHIPPVQLGLSRCSGGFTAVIDDDAVPDDGWIEALLEPFLHDSSVACVGGRVHTVGVELLPDEDAGRIRWYGQYVANVGARDDEDPVSVDGVMEGNWMWRTEILRDLEIDPVFYRDDSTMYGLDLCLQARSKGLSIRYHPGARVVHAGALRASDAVSRTDEIAATVSYSRNYTYIGMKHFNGIRGVVFWVWWVVIGVRSAYGLMSALVDGIRKPRSTSRLFKASMKGRIQGFLAYRAAYRS